MIKKTIIGLVLLLNISNAEAMGMGSQIGSASETKHEWAFRLFTEAMNNLSISASNRLSSINKIRLEAEVERIAQRKNIPADIEMLAIDMIHRG